MHRYAKRARLWLADAGARGTQVAWRVQQCTLPRAVLLGSLAPLPAAPLLRVSMLDCVYFLLGWRVWQVTAQELSSIDFKSMIGGAWLVVLFALVFGWGFLLL